jgi:cytochrome c556
MRRLLVLLLPLTAACAAGVARDSPPPASLPSAAELTAARQAGMHMAATLLSRSILPAARNGVDVKTQQQAADGLDRWGHALPGLFPAGSGGPGSRALPAVWTDKADFTAKANAFGDAAARLAELAEAGDAAGFAAQATIVQQGCNVCHSRYRAEPRRP